MNGRTASGLFASWIALAVFLLAASPSAAATSLPECDGVVLDKGPTLHEGVDSARARGGLPIPPLPDLDPPDIPLPDVLPDGIELIDGGGIADEVLCVELGAADRRGQAQRAREQRQPGLLPRKGGGCKGARKPAHKTSANTARKAVLCLIDKVRNGRNKGGLKPSRSLKRSSKAHNRKMIGSGCFAHQCSGEPALPTRVTKAGYLPCGCAWQIGENLAYGGGRSAAPKTIVKAWMKSPPHKHAILTGFENGDVGVRKGAPGNPNFNGATYTMNFGAKR